MKYIHQLSDWPEFRWDDQVLSSLLAEVRFKQGKHLGQMQSLGFEIRQDASLTALASEIVKSSAIEGEIINPTDVRSSIAKKLGIDIAGITNSNRYVEGVVEMMLDATRQFSSALTKERLFAWHAALFPTGRSGIRKITVGGWRTLKAGPMQVVSGAIGKERVHFEAPMADRIEYEITKFLDWINSALSIDPVLKAAIAHFWFVTIHPFEDGNGRMARAIGEMMLSRADNTEERFYSMSSGIEAEKNDYYFHLEAAQRGSLDITAWLSWFLSCLSQTIDSADEMLSTVLYKAKLWQYINRYSINDRERTVINRLLDGFEGYLTTSKYATLAKCSSDTALRDINELLKYRILEKNVSGGRSTSYRLVELG